MGVILIVLMSISLIILGSICNKHRFLMFTHNKALELAWTFYPILLLFLLAVERFSLLYKSTPTSFVRVKITGYQWYWSYRYSNFSDVEFDSYIVNEGGLITGSKRLLEVDNHLVVPWATPINFLITSGDVLHSWALPSNFVKIDCCPGRVNTIKTSFTLPGVFYGQCREICGVNHSFIPIGVEVTSPVGFLSWVRRA